MGEVKRKKPPARSPEEYENRLISLSMKEAERRIMDGTASSQIICHFLDLATERERLKNERMRSDMRLSDAKIENLSKASMNEEIAQKAIDAMRCYRGETDVPN